jgi:hypothetical protein
VGGIRLPAFICGAGFRNPWQVRESAVAQEYAFRLALIAFATAAVQGLVMRAAFQPALKSALAAAFAFYVLGWLCGEMARRIVEESVALVRSKATVPANTSTQSSPAPGR